MGPVDLVPLARRALEVFGLEGVSAVAVLVLLTVAIWAHKVSKWGGRVTYAGGSTVGYAKATAVILLGLLILGVVSLDLERSRELLQLASQQVQRTVASQGWSW